MRLLVTEGDLLDQDVDVIVNAWNRNPFPWWLLLPQGVSGAIKRRAGLAPFRELRSLAFPLIGAGTGSIRPELAERWMLETFEAASFEGEVRLVRYRTP